MQRKIKYKVIAEDILVENILGGDGLLPSEQALAAKYKTTRTTIRRALEVLKDKGVLESRHGAGNFSKLHGFEENVLQLRWMPKDFAPMGIPYAPVTLPFKIIKPDEHVANKLDISLDDEVYEIVRLLDHEGKVLYLEKGYLPVKLFPPLTQEDFKVKTDFFDKKFQYKVTGAFQKITAAATDSWMAGYFNIALDTPIVAVHLRIQADNRFILYYSKQFYHPDFVMENTFSVKRDA